MKEKPGVVISACLNGFYNRYNGATVSDNEVNALKPLFNLVNVCPEVGIGLGVPRKTVRLVRIEDKLEVIQNETGLDVTRRLHDYSESFLSALEEADGFILKAKSPSCGVKSAKVFKDTEGKIILGKDDGIFVRAAREKFPHLPIIDEGRLKNRNLRWLFLTRVFLHFRFQQARRKAGSLIEFHARAKYLFMSISQKDLRSLGKILAGHKKGSFKDTANVYEQIFYSLLTKPVRTSNLINALTHMFGYVSKKLNQKERNHFLRLVDEYKSGKTDLVTIIELLRSYGYRFGLPYLLNQFLLEDKERN